MFLRKLAKDASAPSDDPKFQTWLAQALNAWSWKKRVHVMLCHNHNDLMAFTTSGESPLRHRHDNRKASPGHENVVSIKERTPRPAPASNRNAMPRGGNSEPIRRLVAGAKATPSRSQGKARLQECTGGLPRIRRSSASWRGGEIRLFFRIQFGPERRSCEGHCHHLNQLPADRWEGRWWR
jgi:hypothetical protein